MDNQLPEPPDAPLFDIDSALRTDHCIKGHGRRQHGMNGKDADLDRVGQCVVNNLTIVDPIGTDNIRIDIELRLYACVCAPSGESFDHEAVIENASPEELEFFKSKGADPRDIDWTGDNEEVEKVNYQIIDILVEYYQDQATSIVCDSSPCDDPYAFMWNDDCWDGGMDVTLSVDMTVEEYNDLESGEACSLEMQTTLADRIAQEIYDSNEGGTPERDKVKRFEEVVGSWNDEINELGCYNQPKKKETE